MIWREPWIWLAGAAVLAILEVFLPGFFLAGFAVGAAVVAALLWVDLAAITLPWLILTFAVASLVAWLLLRALFGIRGGTSKVWKTDVNENPPPE